MRKGSRGAEGGGDGSKNTPFSSAKGYGTMSFEEGERGGRGEKRKKKKKKSFLSSQPPNPLLKKKERGLRR